jgi:hypothetical protein
MGMSKEDERSVALAARAQKGDYDDGGYKPNLLSIANFTDSQLQNSSSNS